MTQEEARQFLKDHGVARMKRGPNHGLNGKVEWTFTHTDGQEFHFAGDENDPDCFTPAIEWATKKRASLRDTDTQPIAAPVAPVEPPPLPEPTVTITADEPDEPFVPDVVSDEPITFGNENELPEPDAE